MVKEEGFKLDRIGEIECVIVRCPTGHRLQGMKVGDLKVQQTIACPKCSQQWTVVAPFVNGFEATV